MAFLLAIKKSQFKSPTHTHHWIITSGMARISVKIKVPILFGIDMPSKKSSWCHNANELRTFLFFIAALIYD
tara:strand:- start:9547 stop:9762 length:216 start_codon:yes stop_codon:yes gene_type:complete